MVLHCLAVALKINGFLARIVGHKTHKTGRKSGSGGANPPISAKKSPSGGASGIMAGFQVTAIDLVQVSGIINIP
jgi:hypothetical protein